MASAVGLSSYAAPVEPTTLVIDDELVTLPCEDDPGTFVEEEATQPAFFPDGVSLQAPPEPPRRTGDP
eukprot:7581890-Pyramimonas_sp.AAC.1